MPNVINTVNINNYTYNVGPSTSGTGSGTPSNVTININPATIVFTKTTDPQYIDLGGSSTLTYSITNTNTEPLTSITITDPLFALPGVTISKLQGATLTDTLLTVTLPAGGLVQNATIRVTAIITVAATALPSSSLYDTTATGSFTLSTIPPSLITKSVKGHLEVNAARLVISKSVSPSVATITAGNLLTYTITITNTGNVNATIPAGAFVDTWTTGGLTLVQVDTGGFTVSDTQVTNQRTLIIAPNETFRIILTATANSPTQN